MEIINKIKNSKFFKLLSNLYILTSLVFFIWIFFIDSNSILVNLDSMYLKGDGNFKLSTYINEPDIFYLYLDKQDGDSLNDIITFFGNKGDIQINTRLSTFDSSFEISGSENSDLLNAYNSIIRKYNLQYLDLLEIFYNAQIENNQ